MSAVSLDKLRALEEKFEGLAAELADPAVMADRERYQATTKAYSDMTPVIEASRRRAKIAQAVALAMDGAIVQAQFGVSPDAALSSLDRIIKSLRKT